MQAVTSQVNVAFCRQKRWQNYDSSIVGLIKEVPKYEIHDLEKIAVEI
jgi:hypothetical protein